MSFLTLQFGQCGNEIGQTLFKYVLDDITDTKIPHNLKSLNQEYVNLSKQIWFTECENSSFTPRSILVDTENKVISSLLNRNDSIVYKNIVSQASGGSANNWALGFASRADLLKNKIMEYARKKMEKTDYILHILNILSSSGGTGSGVGSRIIEYLRDEYPNKNILNVIILPYQRGEVVTQSYNTLLTLAKLYDITDGSIILENDVLHSICNTLLAIKSVDLCHLNEIIAQKLCAVFQPVNGFSLTDFATQLLSHPNFKFVQVKSAPHVAHIDFESLRGWPNLITDMRTRLRSNRETWQLATGDRHKLTSQYYKSVGNILISRGGEFPGDNILEPFEDNKLYPKWVPINHRINYYYQSRLLYKTQEYLTLTSNNNSMCNVLNSILTQAWTLFQHKAYLHFYSKYGVTESTFNEAFEKLEFVFNNYKSI